MKNSKESFRKFVGYLNNSEQDGGYWLPNIQRQFVWKEEQIERLFDSILREYPIGTLLVWKTKSKIRRRKFIDNYRKDIKSTHNYIPEDDKPKMLVLDGQQRLQSLFIGLKGSYEGKELCVNVLSGDLVAPDDIRYKFKFIENSEIKAPWFKLKEIVFSNKEYDEITEDLKSKFEIKLNEIERKKITRIVAKLARIFGTEENLVYQIVDSIDNNELYTEEDIVEIFIRANSGGTFLGKSDLLFSLLIASWDEADENVELLLEKINKTGYKFTKDFILKVCLTLLKKGSAYEIKKFRDIETKKSIINNWSEISNAIQDVKDYVYEKTFIKNDHTLTSYLALIPLIYFRYHYRDKWNKNKTQNYAEYILRVILSGAFSSHSDTVIDACTKQIDESKNFNIDEMYKLLKDNGKSILLTEDNITSTTYSSKGIHVLFNLLYSFNYECTYINNQPEIDHIFPQTQLKRIKTENPETGKKDTIKYKQFDRDQIGNCMLLKKSENGPNEKGEILPEIWFENKSNEYLDLHCIPRDKDLWKIENYEKFIIERKKLLVNKILKTLE